MKPVPRFNEKIPAIVINRIALFFFMMCLLTGFLYFLGTRQEFMDETQFLFLKMTAVLGLLLLIASVFGLIVNLVIFIIKRKIRYLLGFFLFIFFSVSGGFAAAGAYLILFLTTGNIN